MMTPDEFKALFATINDWVATHGRFTRGIVNGYIAVDVFEYEDDKVRISRRRESKAMEILRKENHNPVLMINEDGSTLRYHGEFCYIEDHLKALVAT